MKIKQITCKDNFDNIIKLPITKFKHRISAYGILTKKDCVLLSKNKSNGKFWFPGGGINIGEKIEVGLKREFLEETGLKIKVQNMLLFKENFFYYNPSDEAFHAFLFFFKCKIISGRIYSLNSEIKNFDTSNRSKKLVKYIPYWA